VTFALSRAPNHPLFCPIKVGQLGAKPVVRGMLPALCLLVSGCSLPALPSFPSLPSLAASNSVEEQVGGGIIGIAVPNGNRPDCLTRDECILLKAAEAAQRAGATHFMVLPGHDGKTQPGYAYIRVFNFAAGQGVPSGAVSVEEALHVFRKSPAEAAS
jgi:hypothetical protein